METSFEHILLNLKKADLISHLNSHPMDFEEAMRLAISDKQPYSWRAAWLLWSCMEKNDLRIQAYIKRLIATLRMTNDNQMREICIILQKMELDGEDESELFGVCANIWEKIDKQASVRYNAFKLLIKIVKKHPDLMNEVEYLIQAQYMEPFSATARKAIYQMIT